MPSLASLGHPFVMGMMIGCRALPGQYPAAGCAVSDHIQGMGIQMSAPDVCARAVLTSITSSCQAVHRTFKQSPGHTPELHAGRLADMGRPVHRHHTRSHTRHMPPQAPSMGSAPAAAASQLWQLALTGGVGGRLQACWSSRRTCRGPCPGWKGPGRPSPRMPLCWCSRAGCTTAWAPPPKLCSAPPAAACVDSLRAACARVEASAQC